VECERLTAQGQRLRASTKRLRLDCIKSRVDLAERLADLAHQNRNDERLFTMYTGKAHEAYMHACKEVSNPGWTGTDRAALRTRLDTLRSDLQGLEGLKQRGDPPVAEGPVTERRRKGTRPDENGLECLTSRERQVLKCVAEGRSTKEAACLLGIAFKTASCHRQRTMEKLGVHDASALVRYAIRMGLITP